MEYNFSPEEIRDKVLEFMREKNMYPAHSRDCWLKLDTANFQRYQIEGHKNGSTNGAYVIHTDGIPAAYIQDWSRPGACYTWSMKGGFKASDFDINKWNEQRAAREAEEQQKKAQAIEDAYTLYDKSFNGEIWHAYLERKDVKAYEGVRLDNPTGRLLIPLRDIGGSFKAVQTIDRDGQKRFVYGTSYKGNFYEIGLNMLREGDGKPILVGEGYATMAKVFQLTGLPCVVAVCCNNLEAVITALRGRYSSRPIILMADNDIATFNKHGFNTGMDEAKKLLAAKLITGYIAPPFNPKEPEGSDWDDYAIKFGRDAARELIKKHLRYALLPDDKKKLLSRVECINAQALRTKVFQPIVWAVDGFLPSGLSILAGGPKVGKSILSLHLSLAVAIGGCALGKINVKQGEVLYLALEDTQRRLQERIDGSGLPDNCDISRLDLITTIPRQHEGGLAFIRWWLEEHRQARLVIIDTLQKFRKQLSSKGNVYSEDYDAVSEIKKIADEFNTPFLLIHHLKKAMQDDWLNELSGSQGIAGAADTIFSLKRARTDFHGILHRTGRDVEETDFNMELDGFNWILMDEIDNTSTAEWKKAVIDYLKYRESVTPMDLSVALNIDTQTAQQQLHRLARDGIIKRIRRGVYSLS